MLKIVPDPPHYSPTLEDTLIQASEYALCALAVSHQAIQLQPKSPATALMLASAHELEALRLLIESALLQVQRPAASHLQH